MKMPRISDEDLRAAAFDLASTNELTSRALRKRVGGCDTDRATRIAREVNEELRQTGREGTSAAIALEGIAPVLNVEFERLRTRCAAEIARATGLEADRSRVLLADLETRHRDERDAARRAMDEMRDEIARLDEHADMCMAEITKLNGANADLATSLARREDDLRRALAGHAEERGILTAALNRSREEATGAAVARATAKSVCDALRTEREGLRATMAALEQKVSEAQAANADLMEALTLAQYRLGEADARRERLEADLDGARAEVDTMRAANAALTAKLETQGSIVRYIEQAAARKP